MGLLDSVLGAINSNNNASDSGQGLGGQQGLGALLGALASNPQVMQAITALLSNDGGQGGIGGLIAKFQQAGMGNEVQSWIGNGANMPVSGAQMEQALGGDTLSNLATQWGTSKGEAANQLSDMLPDLLNRLTPAGQAPSGGLGNNADLMGMLTGMLGKS